MKRAVLCRFGSLIAVFFFSFQCYAQDISSTELIKEARQYDGNTVTYRGEVVGDIMIRGDYAWLNVNDGSNAIGIWIKKKMLRGIIYTGDYKAKGDIIEVSGIFHRSCPEHGGDLDLHARLLTKVVSGEPHPVAVNVKKIYLAFLLFMLTASVYLLRKFTRYHPCNFSEK